jgi:hypothetical protein
MKMTGMTLISDLSKKATLCRESWAGTEQRMKRKGFGNKFGRRERKVVAVVVDSKGMDWTWLRPAIRTPRLRKLEENLQVNENWKKRDQDNNDCPIACSLWCSLSIKSTANFGG